MLGRIERERGAKGGSSACRDASIIGASCAGSITKPCGKFRGVGAGCVVGRYGGASSLTQPQTMSIGTRTAGGRCGEYSMGGKRDVISGSSADMK